MSQFPERNLNQTAVYWGGPVNNGYGKFTFSAEPIEIPCRWIESVEVVKRSDGSEVISKVQVRVKQDLVENGMLLLGLLTDLSDAQLADPYEAGAFQIVSVAKTPTVKATKFFRKVYV